MNNLIKIENGQITVAQEFLEEFKALNQARLRAEMLEKELKAELLHAMEEYGIKKWSNDYFQATYIAETERSSVDTKRLKEELPDIAEEYSRTSKVKSSVRVSFND